MSKYRLQYLPKFLAIAAAFVVVACSDKVPTDLDTPAMTSPSVVDNRVDLGPCDSLAVPAGHTLKTVTYAQGVQIYRWNGSSWVFDAPEAVLTADADGNSIVGTHFRGPTWQSNSGSRVVGAVAKRCTPDANSIAWLLLTGSSSEGPGIFDGVTFIQRINTQGGNAPASRGTTVGEEARVPYTTIYVFYRAATSPSAAQLAGPRASATLDWQEEARSLVAANRMSPLAAGRVLAALSLAQFRAAQSVDAGNAEQGGGRAEFEAQRGAVAGASSKVLAFFFASAGTALEQKVAEQGEAGPGSVHPEFTRGVAIGRAMADEIIERCKNDGFTKPWVGPAPTGDGIWTPVALPPAGGTFGEVTPYFMTSGSQFRPAAPPTFGSAAFNADLNQVVNITQNRTPEQLALAASWDYPTGTSTPVGYWNEKAAEYVEQKNLDDFDAARVFGLMHTAQFDALVGCWDAKYYYWTIRPYQASSSVSRALGAPNHPSYPSGHSCVSASAARVLEHFFPDRADELDALVTEAGMSRVYAGIHFLFDVTAGQQLGRAAADWAIAKSGM